MPLHIACDRCGALWPRLNATYLSSIDQDVQGLLGERYETVCKLLTGKCQQLDRLAEALLHNETIDEVTIEKVLGARVKDTTETK